ncbi:MAG: hypothetical protein F6K30_03860, partial [Cyanothece sp. SIO2G6]|nr:hypothetical protein [Cyanothece sp. SIO2G6]
MSIRRSLSLSVLSVLAIAGGLFVSDRRIGMDVPASPTIQTGNALQLGVLLTDQPRMVDRNQMITNALFRLRDQVNQCGGVNQAPVFWAMLIPDAETLAEASALESLGMKTLLWQKRVHGAIAAFTDSPISHALYSDALNVALEAELPIISPTNSQFLVAQAGRFDQFRRVRPVVVTQTNAWVRTIPSDRQQLTAVAQWLQQNNWTQIATIAPDTPRGEHLATLLNEAIAGWDQDDNKGIIQPIAVRYQVENVAIAAALEPEKTPALAFSDDVLATVVPEPIGAEPSPEADASADTATNAPTGDVSQTNQAQIAAQIAEVEATIEFLTDLDRESWVDPPPDVVVLILDPNLSSLGMTAL